MPLEKGVERFCIPFLGNTNVSEQHWGEMMLEV
jgi:hypothetical protein